MDAWLRALHDDPLLVCLGARVVGGYEYVFFARTSDVRTDQKPAQMERALVEIAEGWARVASSERKLGDRGFAERAPRAVVELEERKWADAMAGVTLATDRLGRLLNNEHC